MNILCAMNQVRPLEVSKPKLEDDSDTILPFKVIMFNDDFHTFDEVIQQLVKALKCSFEQAKAYAFEAHNKGLAIVFSGELSKCLRVSGILEEIELQTRIES